jgi:hypothetical protein
MRVFSLRRTRPPANLAERREIQLAHHRREIQLAHHPLPMSTNSELTKPQGTEVVLFTVPAWTACFPQPWGATCGSGQSTGRRAG